MNRKTQALVLIFCLIPLGPLAIDIYLPSMLQMAEHFSVGNGQIQLTIALFVAALGVGQLVAGPLSDRYGRRCSALVGLCCYALGSFYVALSASLVEVYWARVLQGLGAAFTMVTAMAWVRDNYEGEEAGKWLSYMGGLTTIIPTLAPLLGGLLAELWGWRSGFYAMAIFSSGLLVLALLSLPSSKPAIAVEGEVAGLATILASAQFRTYSLANLFSFTGLLSYIATAPVVAMQQAGLSKLGFALVFGAIGLVQLLASLSAPRLVAVIGQRKLVLTGLSLAFAAGMGLVLFAQHSAVLFFVLAAFGCAGFSLLVGTATALNMQPFASSAGLAAAIDGTQRMLGAALLVAVIASFDLPGHLALAVGLLLTLLPMVLVWRDIRLQPCAQQVYG